MLGVRQAHAGQTRRLPVENFPAAAAAASRRHFGAALATSSYASVSDDFSSAT